MTNPLIKDWQIDPAALGGGTGVWEDDGTVLVPIAGVSQNIRVPGGKVSLGAGATDFVGGGSGFTELFSASGAIINSNYGAGAQVDPSRPATRLVVSDSYNGGGMTLDWVAADGTVATPFDVAPNGDTTVLGVLMLGRFGGPQANIRNDGAGNMDYRADQTAGAAHYFRLSDGVTSAGLYGGYIDMDPGATGSFSTVRSRLVVTGRGEFGTAGVPDTTTVRHDFNAVGNSTFSANVGIALGLTVDGNTSLKGILSMDTVNGGMIYMGAAGGAYLNWQDATGNFYFAPNNPAVTIINATGVHVQTAGGHCSVGGTPGGLYGFEAPLSADPNGQGYANTWIDASVRILKQNERAVDDALNIVMDPTLQAVRYEALTEVSGDWLPDKGDPPKLDADGVLIPTVTQIGFVADDWYVKVPEVVSAPGGIVRGMTYGRVTAIVFQALKEYITQTDATIADLTARLAALEGTP